MHRQRGDLHPLVTARTGSLEALLNEHIQSRGNKVIALGFLRADDLQRGTIVRAELVGFRYIQSLEQDTGELSRDRFLAGFAASLMRLDQHRRGLLGINRRGYRCEYLGLVEQHSLIQGNLRRGVLLRGAAEELRLPPGKLLLQ